MSIKQLPSGIEVRIRQDLSEGSRGDTTLIIDPIITKAGYRVTMDDIGVRGFGKIDANNPREEIISWTGMTDNGTTYTLTGVVWGINFHNSTGNFTDNMKRHISGAKFSINTDMHYIADNYVNKRDFNATDNSIGWGDGTKDENKVLEARNGTANLPFIVYNETVDKWLISNDGINTYDIVAGGGGLEAGIATMINAGKIDVQISDDAGVNIDDNKITIFYQDNPGLYIDGNNKLGVKIKEDTGLVKDADGLWCDSIDPDNPVAQSPAQLIGGTDVVLQNFIDLGLGDNDGAFKATIDGVEYDNISVDLSLINIEPEISEDLFLEIGDTSSRLSGAADSDFYCQIVEFTKDLFFTKFSFQYSNADGSLKNYYIYNVDGNNKPTGSPIVLGINGISAASGLKTITLASPILVSNGTKLAIVVSAPGTQGLYYSSPSTYQNLWLTNNFSTYTAVNGDLYLNIYTKDIDEELFIENIATNIQTAIRAETGKLETVEWDSEKFIITSTISGKNNGSQVLRFEAPTIGTDISGAGYLDLGANATEVASDGDDYRLVRLDSNGQIPVEIFNNLSNTVFDDIDTTAKSLDTVYQNTTDKNKLVIASIYFHITVGADMTSVGQIGETNNPTTVVSTARIKGGSYPDSGTIPVFMLVKPGWYYRVSGGTSVASWFECDLI